MTRRKQDARALLQQALAALGSADPANDDEAIDEATDEELRELARRDADEMMKRRAR